MIFAWVLFAALASDVFSEAEKRQLASTLPIFWKRFQIVETARSLSRREFPHVHASGRCLYDTACLLFVAAREGIFLTPQAGSAFWRIVSEEQDDGVSITHFGYEWEPDSALTHFALAQGLLPEMHVWAGDPVRQEIVDVTTWEFPDQARELIGAEWKTPLPPDFLWCKTSEIPQDAEYKPSKSATEIAWKLMQRVMRERGLSR